MADLEFLGGMSPKTNWVKIRGTVVDMTSNEVKIAPTEDEKIHIVHARRDVAIGSKPDGGLDVYVKIGAKRARKDILPGSNYDNRPPGMANSKHCGGGESECIGGAEYCCDTGLMVGGCSGETRCP